jgi:hypothetical protein
MCKGRCGGSTIRRVGTNLDELTNMNGDTFSNPMVSVVIPVNNGSNYLEQAIDSCFAQTYSSLEVLVVNDGSNDGGKTREIALRYGNKIRYFEKENGGVSTALNYGIREMRGDWFAWLSHDDLFDPVRFSSDLEILRNGPYLISYCRWRHIDEGNKVIGIGPELPPLVCSPRHVMEMGGVDLCSMTINRKCFDRAGLFNPCNRTMQDVEMGVRLAIHFDFVHNPNSVTSRRMHQESGSVRLRSVHRKDERLFGIFLRNKLKPVVFSRDMAKEKNPAKMERAYAECLAAFGQKDTAILLLTVSALFAAMRRSSWHGSLIATVGLLQSLLWERFLRALPSKLKGRIALKYRLRHGRSATSTTI